MLIHLRRRKLMAALGAGALALTGMSALTARPAAAEARNALDFGFTSIDGGTLPLSAYAGKVVLVVNTASRCGFTPQYEGLQALWDARRGEDFVLIGVPSDDFNQELASEAAVKEFCETVFSIDFPMTEITRVRGPRAHPFFKHAARTVGAPSWNFNKFLIGRDGRLVRRYGSRDRPDEIEADIDVLLAADRPS